LVAAGRAKASRCGDEVDRLEESGFSLAVFPGEYVDPWGWRQLQRREVSEVANPEVLEGEGCQRRWALVSSMYPWACG
jgi:hypothetical protein